MATRLFRDVKQLAPYLLGDGPPLVITGAPGAGKTTLCEKLAEQLGRGAHPCVYVSIEQSVRTGFDESLVEELDRRVRRELGARGIGYRVLRSRTEKDGPTLPYFEVEGARLLLILDGLDHLLSHQGIDASFLPLEIPRGMRLAVSVSHGPLLDALIARGWQAHELAPLGESERRGIADERLGEREGKQALVEALAAWPPGGNPTHLLLAIELAKASGAGPGPSDDVTEVAARVVAPWREPPSSPLAFLAVAEYGLPAWTSSKQRSQQAWLHGHAPAIVERRGFHVPALAEVREAMCRRFTEDELREAHGAVFESYSDHHGLRLFQEAAEHLLAVGAHERLAGFLTQLEPFQYLINNNSAFLERCWRTMRFGDGPERHARMVDAVAPTLDAEGRIAMLNNVGMLADKMDWRPAGVLHLRRALEEARNAFPATHAKVGTAALNLAIRLAKDSGTDQEVEALYQQLLATLDGPVPVAGGYPRRWVVLRSYASFLEARKRDDEGLARRDEVLMEVRKDLGERHPQVGLELLWTSRAIRWRLPGRALADAEQALEILRAAVGSWSDRTAFALRMVAGARHALGRTDEALPMYREALEISRKLTLRHPLEAAYAWEALFDIADARDDRRTALGLREQQYEHCQQYLGPSHTTTLSYGWTLALRREADGQFLRALELVEALAEGYRARGGPNHTDVLACEVAAARLAWRLGRRGEAEARLGARAGAIAEHATVWTRAQSLLLRSEWAWEDCKPTAGLELLEKGLEACRESSDVTASVGLAHVMLGARLFQTGDFEASARHHEAGIGLVDDGQLYLRALALRPYQAAPSLPAELEGTRRRRRDELSLRFAFSSERARLHVGRLPGRALRAVWNPGDGRTLAVLDRTGESHLFVWHPESAQLERLEQPFAKRALPKDLSAITLRWSASGQALRFATPDGEETLGSHHPGESWAPASPISPDARFTIYLGDRSVSAMHAPSPVALRAPASPPRGGEA